MTEITYAGRIPALPSRNSYTSIMIIISAFVRCMSLCATRSARLDDPTQLTAQGGIDMMRRHIPGRRHVSALRWGGTEHSDGWRKSSRRGAARRRLSGAFEAKMISHRRFITAGGAAGTQPVWPLVALQKRRRRRRRRGRWMECALLDHGDASSFETSDQQESRTR